MLLIIVIVRYDVKKCPFHLEMLLDTCEMTPCLGFASMYSRKKKGGGEVRIGHIKLAVLIIVEAGDSHMRVHNTLLSIFVYI